jgi:hypothetical protein
LKDNFALKVPVGMGHRPPLDKVIVSGALYVEIFEIPKSTKGPLGKGGKKGAKALKKILETSRSKNKKSLDNHRFLKKLEIYNKTHWFQYDFRGIYE